ncbi:MAG: hypothetical protein M1816_000721 [Peltula sp. TS41687]|nr:MAG: hypothetical protein M1816_000721 [Peltula sp. TS41687]
MSESSLVKHEVFTKWAKEQGVQICKVAAARFPGRGLGIVATDNIKAGDVLAVVPVSTLITASLVSADVRRKLGRITVHGLLAAILTLDAQRPKSTWQEWRAVWPSRQDFKDTIPLLWESQWPELLPPGAKEILRGQIRKSDKDFKLVLKAFPEVAKEDYLYHWLVVNSRSFYYIIPGMMKLPPSDCMALCPFMDYFNHAETGVKSPVSLQERSPC